MVDFGITTVAWLDKAEYNDLVSLRIKPFHARVLKEQAKTC